MLLAAFRVAYPEFVTVPDALAQRALDDSAAQTSSTEFGLAYDVAHGLLAAHTLAIAVFGQSARTIDDGKKTTYELQLDGVRARFIVSATVAGITCL